MTKAATRSSFRDIPKTYRGLVARLPPRPIHDEVDLRNAMEMIDRMAGFKLNADQKITWRPSPPSLKPMKPPNSRRTH